MVRAPQKLPYDFVALALGATRNAIMKCMRPVFHSERLPFTMTHLSTTEDTLAKKVPGGPPPTIAS